MYFSFGNIGRSLVQSGIWNPDLLLTAKKFLPLWYSLTCA